jgi:hypothetical protein
MLVVGLHYHISQGHKIKGAESVHSTDNVWQKVGSIKAKIQIQTKIIREG